MSTYWTEETIITEERTYLKCLFKGRYHAERLDERSLSHSEYFQMTIYEGEAIIDEIRKYPQSDFHEASTAKSFTGSFTQPISCFDKSTGTYFKLNIQEPKIADVKLSDVVMEGSERYGTVTGILYGHIIKYGKEIVKTPYERSATLIATDFIKDQAEYIGWIRTAKHEFSVTGGIRRRRDYYSHTDGSGKWGTWYTLGRVSTFRTGISTIFGFGILALLFLFLIGLSWPGYIILGCIFLAFHFSRLFRTSFGGTLYLLFLLCYLSAIGIATYNNAKVKHSVTASPLHVNSPDYTTTKPINNSRRHTVKPKPSLTDTIAQDQWIIHHKSWTDLAGNQYEGDVKVLQSALRNAETRNHAIAEAQTLSSVYASMTSGDAKDLGHVYTLFDSLQRTRHLDSTTFASMIVSFVQNIPYVAVKDGDCTEDKDFVYSQPQGPSSASCIGNVPYGVQSPVEFMANFQGDCDTRTLFLFTIFNHYKYKVAMLGSEAFRHSLLGMQLPLNGSSKMLGNQRYLLWETTSAGFIPGQLPPQIDHLEYWNFNLVNQP